MKRVIDTNFFRFSQNNSGGYFIENEDVAIHLIIEALSAREAKSKMEDITASYSQYCSCCGERWSSWIDDDDGTEEPQIYGEPITTYRPSYRDETCVIYYSDGRKENILIKERIDRR
jgi:hypothetical protein